MSAAHAPEAATATLLGVYLLQLRLPAIGRTYQQVARDAAQAQQSYAQFLLAVLGRLTHRCQVLEFRAESFRLKQSLGRGRPAPAVCVRTEEGTAAKSRTDE